MNGNRLLIVGSCLLFAIAPKVSFAQLTFGAYESVYKISPTPEHKETASSFWAQVNGAPQWITAKHVFESTGYPKETTISVYRAGVWQDLKVGVTYSAIYDLALIHWTEAPADTQGIPICDFKKDELSSDTMLYFLGFPFGLSVEAGTGSVSINFPLVKHAWWSGSQPIDDAGHRVLVLDAINNYGFSGGPIIRTSSVKPFYVCLVGVTSGFRPDTEQVVVAGQKVAASVPYNTGLMIGVPAIAIAQTLAVEHSAPQR